MEEIPHHPTCIKPCKKWDKLPYQLVQEFFRQQSVSFRECNINIQISQPSRPSPLCASRNVDVSTVRSWNSSNASSSNTWGFVKSTEEKSMFFGSPGMSTTLPETNSSPLKNRPGPERKLVFQASIFRCENVSFREGILF